MQRQGVGTSKNSSVQAFCINTQALRVINSVCGGVSQGNCRKERSPSVNWTKKMSHYQKTLS